MTCEDFMEMLKAHENVLITQVCIHHFPIKNHKNNPTFLSEPRLENKIEIFNQQREIAKGQFKEMDKAKTKKNNNGPNRKKKN